MRQAILRYHQLMLEPGAVCDPHARPRPGPEPAEFASVCGYDVSVFELVRGNGKDLATSSHRKDLGEVRLLDFDGTEPSGTSTLIA